MNPFFIYQKREAIKKLFFDRLSLLFWNLLLVTSADFFIEIYTLGS